MKVTAEVTLRLIYQLSLLFWNTVVRLKATAIFILIIPNLFKQFVASCHDIVSRCVLHMLILVQFVFKDI